MKKKTKGNKKIISISKYKPQEGKKLGNNFNLFLLTLNMITVHPTENTCRLWLQVKHVKNESVENDFQGTSLSRGI